MNMNKGHEKLPAKNVRVVLVPFDAAHKIRVAIPAFASRSTECPFTSSRCCVPYFDGQIVRSSSNHCVVDTPLDVVDPLGMTLQDMLHVSGIRAEDAPTAICGSRG